VTDGSAAALVRGAVASAGGAGVVVFTSVADVAGLAFGAAGVLDTFTATAGDFAPGAAVVLADVETEAGGSIGASVVVSPAVAGAGITGRRSFEASSMR